MFRLLSLKYVQWFSFVLRDMWHCFDAFKRFSVFHVSFTTLNASVRTVQVCDMETINLLTCSAQLEYFYEKNTELKIMQSAKLLKKLVNIPTSTSISTLISVFYFNNTDEEYNQKK